MFILAGKSFWCIALAPLENRHKKELPAKKGIFMAKSFKSEFVKFYKEKLEPYGFKKVKGLQPSSSIIIWSILIIPRGRASLEFFHAAI